MEAFVNEPNYTVWSDLSCNLGILSTLLSHTDFYEEIQEFVKDVFSPIGERLGWDPKPGEGNECTKCGKNWSEIGPFYLSYLLLLLFSCSVMSDSATPWTAAHQASLSFTISWSLLKLVSIELVMPSNHLVLCRPLLLPSVFPSIRVFSNELKTQLWLTVTSSLYLLDITMYSAN